MHRSVKQSKLDLHLMVTHINDLSVRGLGFKFVDFLCKISDICLKEIEMQLSENTLFYLSYKV